MESYADILKWHHVWTGNEQAAKRFVVSNFFPKDYMLRVILDYAKFAKLGSSVSRCMKKTKNIEVISEAIKVA